MALQIHDRVKESTLTTGTGPLALAGPAVGYQAFSAVCSVNDTCYYAIEAVDANGVATGAWEVGLGTYSAASQLTRTTPQDSSNGGAAVAFAAGTKNVWIDITATEIGTLAPTASPILTGQISAASGLVGSPTYSFTGDLTTGFWRRAAGNLGFAITGVDSYSWNSVAFSPVANNQRSLGGANVGWVKLYMAFVNTGTVGNVTINNASGRVNIAAAGSSVVVTCGACTAAAHVFANLNTVDATAKSAQVTPAAGSFTITLNAACTAQVAIDFFIVNAD